MERLALGGRLLGRPLDELGGILEAAGRLEASDQVDVGGITQSGELVGREQVGAGAIDPVSMLVYPGPAASTVVLLVSGA